MKKKLHTYTTNWRKNWINESVFMSVLFTAAAVVVVAATTLYSLYIGTLALLFVVGFSVFNLVNLRDRRYRNESTMP